MAKKYKCPYCNDRYIRKDLIDHIDKEHEDVIPDGFESAQVVYDVVNGTKGAGKCRVCGRPTKWNSSAKRYDVLCENPMCKQKMREEYQKNMLRVHGTYNILTSDEQQKKMLANRSISGKYKFTDGGVVTYTGSYEKKFLEFADKVMQIPSKDIMAPGPTIEYEMNGEKHFYITDFLYIPYNLIIEVKDGGSNPNNKNSVGMQSSRQRTIEKEKLITDRGEYHYLRLTDNQFVQLLEIFMDIKKALIEGNDGKIVRIHESSENMICDNCGSNNIAVYFRGEPVYICKDCDACLGVVPFPKNESAINESKSTIDKNYKPKGKKNLPSFKRVHITEAVIDKYKKEYPFLKHVRCKDAKEYTCDGYIWFDNDELVAMVGSCEYTDDKTKWIVSLEITKNYKGYGLSKQILDYAVKTMNCKYLSVNKNNEVAKKVYDDYGFKVYQESDTMYYMTIDKNVKESTNVFTSGDFAEYREAGEKRLKELMDEDNFHNEIMNMESVNKSHHDDNLSAMAHAYASMQYLSEASNTTLYHLSQDNLDGKTLSPRIPSNFLIKNGYEDGNTKRVCFAKSIDGSLRGMSQNLKGIKLYVHIPEGNYDIYNPTIKEVPDCKVTGEVWIKEPVKLKCIGSIEVIADTGEDGIPYKYGNNTAELYDWEWKWIDKFNESSIFEANVINENMVFNKKDLEINLDKFESGKSNVLLITGFSGSGKSTLANSLASKYKCINYELDCLGFYLKGYLTRDNAIGNEDGLVEFIDKKNLSVNKNISYEDEVSLYREYIKFLINWCKKQKDKKFVIEGLQLYETYKDGDSHITSCPIIIKGTSGLVSAIRAAKRNDGSFIKEFGPLIKWAFRDNKMLNKLKKDLEESSIFESNILNEKDIYYNKDKFDSGEINLCFITGHSGSGKSTMGKSMAKDNIEHYDIDDILSNWDFSDSNLKDYGDLIYSFFKGPGKKFRYTSGEDAEKEWTRDDIDYYTNSYECLVTKAFVKHSMNYAKSHKNTKFVIEGIWLYEFIKPEELSGYAVYIKGTSALISKIRAAKRNSSYENSKIDKIKDFIRRMSHKWKFYYLSERQIRTYRDYFSKLESMKESSISEAKLSHANISLEDFKAYHLEPKIAGKNKKHLGGWDEEQYFKTIDHAINDIADHYEVKRYNTFQAYVYTAGKDLKAIYIGTILIRDKFNPSDWEWVEQAMIKDSDYKYLKHYPMVEALDISNFYDEDFYE